MKVTQQINDCANIQGKQESGRGFFLSYLFSRAEQKVFQNSFNLFLFSFFFFFSLLYFSHRRVSASVFTFYCRTSITHLRYHPCVVYLFPLEKTVGFYTWGERIIS